MARRQYLKEIDVNKLKAVVHANPPSGDERAYEVYEQPEFSLRFVTHDARKLLNLCGVKQLAVRWQTLLMELCYNHTYQKAASIIRREVDRHPESTFAATLAGIAARGLGGPIRTAHFTPQAIHHLLLIDRRILTSDFDTHLDLLANVLGAVQTGTLKEFMNDMDRCSMWIFLSRLDDFFNHLRHETQALRKMALVPMPSIGKPMSGESRSILTDAVQELKKFRR
jgi:hypothetical protein